MSTTMKKTGKKAVKLHRTTKPARGKPKKTSPAASRKPLRIREDLLPESAKYITVDEVEYIAMPVAEFGEWYEDALDGAVIDHIESLNEPAIPADEVMKNLGIKLPPRKK